MADSARTWRLHGIRISAITSWARSSAGTIAIFPAEDLAHEVIAEIRIPCNRHVRAESAIERLERIFVLSARRVADQREADGRLVNLTLQSRCLAIRQITLVVDRIGGLVYHLDLLAVQFIRRHREFIAEAVSQR